MSRAEQDKVLAMVGWLESNGHVVTEANLRRMLYVLSRDLPLKESHCLYDNSNRQLKVTAEDIAQMGGLEVKEGAGGED